MKILCVLVLSFSVSLSINAQSNKSPDYRVTGQVVEKISGKSVPYATVVFKNDTIKEKKMLACDPEGHFSLTVGTADRYLLIISAVGFREFNDSVSVTELKTDLGKISIDEGTEIQAVTVTAQKPLVKVDVDKIVYSMESDPEAQTNNALEMLSKVPLINVDAEENITLNGQSNFKVLVDGKSSSMMSTNFKDVLKSLPANTIKDIEVITNPSSKYDAEGVGGIINIITLKKSKGGYNGSVSAGVDSRGSFNGSAFLAAQIRKFSFSARYHTNQFRQPESSFEGSREYFNNSDFHYSNSQGQNEYKGLSNGFSGEASYDIDSLDLISLSFWGYKGAYDNNGLSFIQYMNTSNEVTRQYESDINSKNSYGMLSGNIDYQKTFKKPDKSFTVSYKLDNYPNTTRNISDIVGTVNYPSYTQRSENDALGREQTIQTDYYDPISPMHQIEGGVKYIFRQNTSTSENFRNDTLNVSNGNNLDYNQYILGAYLGYVWKLKKISTKTGLRIERTWNDGESVTSGVSTDFTNRLFNLVPYITLNWMPTAAQTVKLSYTQRLSRPGIWYLNPYVYDIDSMNIRYGNPRLEAEIAHSFELGYTYFTPKFNISVTSSASFVNNSIESISSVKPNGASETTYKNIGKDQRYGVNIYANYRPSGKLNAYFNGGISYSKLEANTAYAITNEGFSGRGSFGGRWTAWKDGSVNVNAGLFSADIMLQGKSSTFFYTSIGVSQYLLKRKMMLGFSASDPFWRTKTYVFDSEDITFKSHNVSSFLAQTLRFNVTYNFGKMDLQVKKARRGIQNDDVKSGGNSDQGQGQ
jgi:outer membrane receptor protein involved in Fe transport